MHEVGLLSAAVARLTAAAGGRPLRRVEVRLGPGVDPDTARQGWAHAVRGSPAETAEVTWVRAHDTLVCFQCGHEYTGDQLTACPRCGGSGLVTAPAPEIDIADWEPAPNGPAG